MGKMLFAKFFSPPRLAQCERSRQMDGLSSGLGSLFSAKKNSFVISAHRPEITNEGEGLAPSSPPGQILSHAEAQRAQRMRSPPTPRSCGRGIASPHCRGVPAFAGHKSILRMYLTGTASIERFMPTNLSMSAMRSAQWYCATFRGTAFSLGRHPALNSCQRLLAICMRM